MPAGGPSHQIGRTFDIDLPEHLSRANECIIHLVRIGDLFLERIIAVTQQHGLSGLEANVLSVLYAAREPLPPHVISERLLVTRGAITKVLDGLVERGYVRRFAHQYDRRMLLIELTDDGLTVMKQYKPDMYHQSAQWVQSLSDEEQEILVMLLKKLQPSSQPQSD
ncbi:MarR family winged helix-turn-helix transcriptional regulator [Dictyobacter aurantiacus]|uniref:Putative transcriptional regulator, MarR family protein n=1 Tax=Dictyobacter aurantiacus TaxID=1936993 RepID=A0A401Z9L8_9CHLR|nr:MarR family transcriptional regulator [Dictyobacter aurantiacus]GCE03545.1 putative transcriptional regulator, MarR family protein [Dictyobacter aurantiacus]